MPSTPPPPKMFQCLNAYAQPGSTSAYMMSANPDQLEGVYRQTPASANPYKYIISGNYAKLLCGPDAIPSGATGNCVAKPKKHPY